MSPQLGHAKVHSGAGQVVKEGDQASTEGGLNQGSGRAVSLYLR